MTFWYLANMYYTEEQFSSDVLNKEVGISVIHLTGILTKSWVAYMP